MCQCLLMSVILYKSNVAINFKICPFDLCFFRMLLWHGSRLTNWVGILSQGLRVAPPEAPVTGYMVRRNVTQTWA